MDQTYFEQAVPVTPIGSPMSRAALCRIFAEELSQYEVLRRPAPLILPEMTEIASAAVGDLLARARANRIAAMRRLSRRGRIG